MQGVYEIRNMKTGDHYIGSSEHIEHRWARHKQLLRAGLHHSKALQHAWNSYGQEAFVFEMREHIADEVDRLTREAELIASERPPYNTIGAEGADVDPAVIRSRCESAVRARVARRAAMSGQFEIPDRDVNVFRCPCCNQAFLLILTAGEFRVGTITEEDVRRLKDVFMWRSGAEFTS